MIIATGKSAAQTLKPEVIFQSGFFNNIESHYSFSPTGKYLTGINDAGEYLIWDVKTGKQVKKIGGIIGSLPSFNYINPPHSFSRDEQFMLIPDYPNGKFILYDFIANKNVHIFKPEYPSETYTHGMLSPDGSRIMLVGQRHGADHFCEILICNRKGDILSRSAVNLPLFKLPDHLLIKLLFGKALKSLDNMAYLQSIVTNDQMDCVYFTLLMGDVYALNLTGKKNFSTYDLTKIMKIQNYSPGDHFSMSLYENKLLIKGRRIAIKLDSVSNLVKDSIFVVNTGNLKIEKAVLSSYPVLVLPHRTNSLAIAPIMTSQNLSVWFNYKRNSAFNYEVTAHDMISNKVLFSYANGEKHSTKKNAGYQEGQLNRGNMIAISPDHQLLAEIARDIIVHQVKKKKIESIIASTRGQLRLGAPLFLDQHRMLIPKTYNDGFVFHLKSGLVEQLKRELNIQDTLDNGAFAYYSYDNTAQIGIQNAALLPGTGQFATANMIPDKDGAVFQNKIITVWDSQSLTEKAKYTYKDKECTYHLNGIAGFPKRFLVNYKLVNFEDSSKVKQNMLYIVKNRDTFYAVNPVYLPQKKQIIAITATRSKPGQPNSIFATWDINGKLLKTYTYKRKKSKAEYQNIIYESQLSPDSTKLLYGLYDGTAGIFDLEKMKVTSTYVHGKAITLKDYYQPIPVTAACFIDDTHFLTSGGDNLTHIWKIGSPTPERTFSNNFHQLLSASLSPDKKYLIGVDLNKTLHFTNLATGIADVNFVALNEQAYMFLNNEGFYMSNKKSNNELSFFYGGRTYEFSQFDLLLNRPDKVLFSLGYTSKEDLAYLHKAWDRRIEGLNYKPIAFDQLADIVAPEIELLGLPEQLQETNSTHLTFKIFAKDLKSPLKRLLISVNGVPVYGSKGKSITSTVRKGILLPVSIPLSPGQNQIEISVTNAQGTESLTRSLRITRRGSVSKPNLYLIAIGAGKFAQSDKNLNYAVKDARDMVILFKEKASNYAKVYVDTLLNEKVTPANILKLRARLQSSKPDDMIVLYYAGHGIIDKKSDYYLSAYQSNFQNPASTSIKYEKLAGLLDSIACRNKIMLIDACYSGEIDKIGLHNKQKKPAEKINSEQQQKAFSLMQTFFSDLRKSSGTSEIGASGPAENAQEIHQLQNGVFTYFLKKGLHEQKADLNRDGQISISELADYLRDQVYLITDQEQQPTFRNQNIVNDTILWK